MAKQLGNAIYNAAVSVPLQVPEVSVSMPVKSPMPAMRSPQAEPAERKQSGSCLTSAPCWLSIDDLAVRLGRISTRTVRRMWDSGELPRPVYLRGRSMPRWSVKEIEQWEASKLASREAK